jgi:hypothetical protein
VVDAQAVDDASVFAEGCCWWAPPPGDALPDLAGDFFALGTEHHAPKLGNDQLQMFDLIVASKQLLLLRHHKGFERFSIQSAQINNAGMCISHGTEYAIVTSQS